MQLSYQHAQGLAHLAATDPHSYQTGLLFTRTQLRALRNAHCALSGNLIITAQYLNI